MTEKILTHKLHDKEMINTVKGSIPAREWAENEVARINAKGGHASIKGGTSTFWIVRN